MTEITHFFSNIPSSIPLKAYYDLEFYVPTQSNDGVPFSREKYIRLESVLARLANGYTRKAGLNGGWMHEGILYRDVLYAYHVVIPVVAMPFEQLPRFKNLLAKEFRQIDIFMRCTPVFMV